LLENQLFCIQLFFKRLNLSTEPIIFGDDSIDLGADGAGARALLLIAFGEGLERVVFEEDVALQVIFSLLQRRALLAQIRTLLL